MQESVISKLYTELQLGCLAMGTVLTLPSPILRSHFTSPQHFVSHIQWAVSVGHLEKSSYYMVFGFVFCVVFGLVFYPPNFLL